MAPDKPAACELTWGYLFPERPLPRAVRLLSLWDVWDHAEPDVAGFQYGMRARGPRPENQLWRTLFHDSAACEMVDVIAREGCAIAQYRERSDSRLVHSASFRTRLDGYDALAVNRLLANADVFDAHSERKRVPLLIMFGWDGRPAWRVTLSTAREGEVDCSKIAVRHGGGGHAGCAGFVCRQLPFDLQAQESDQCA